MNRRSFIASGAGAAAALAFHAQAKTRDIRKAIMYETIRIDAPVLGKFKAVKEAGFVGIEPMSHMSQSEVLDAFGATGLKPASVCCATHWKQPLSDPDAAVRKAGLDGLMQALRDAKAYGASSVLLVPAVVNKKVSYTDAYQRSQTEIRKAIPLAQELGVKIAIENVWNLFLLSPLEAARYVDEFESPAVGWHFDVGNVINYGYPEQWIRILGKRIQKLHIKEYSRAKRDKEGPSAGFRVPLMTGDDDWPAVMAALDEIGYAGWGIAEQFGSNSPEGLRNISDAMDKIFAS
ncbi:MAG TPA: sugar phosphate isomerase/epimerase family protein [Bryobacteraceae bacterium]|nr:sugar phosphate isomerase/epimerase family protein [Bryobacteraceae bacterium]